VSPVRSAVRKGASGDAAFGRQRPDLRQWHFQVLVNVVAQGLERRDVDDFGVVRQRSLPRPPDQTVDGHQECRQRFPRSGGRGIRTSFPWLISGQPRDCGSCRVAETRGEPFRDEGIEPGEH